MATIVNPVQVQKYLKGVDYPCSTEELVNAAKSQGADENVISTLRQIPPMQFSSSDEVAGVIERIGATSRGEDVADDM